MITKEQFEVAYKNHPPTKLEIFHIKYFSVDALKKNKWLTWLVAGILFVPFLFGFIASVAGASKIWIAAPTIAYTGMLGIFGLIWIYVWFKIRNRINKIRRELGVTMDEYNALVSKYYFNPSPDLYEYIKNNITERNELGPN